MRHAIQCELLCSALNRVIMRRWKSESAAAACMVQVHVSYTAALTITASVSSLCTFFLNI